MQPGVLPVHRLHRVKPALGKRGPDGAVPPGDVSLKFEVHVATFVSVIAALTVSVAECLPHRPDVGFDGGAAVKVGHLRLELIALQRDALKLLQEAVGVTCENARGIRVEGDPVAHEQRASSDAVDRDPKRNLHLDLDLPVIHRTPAR